MIIYRIFSLVPANITSIHVVQLCTYVVRTYRIGVSSAEHTGNFSVFHIESGNCTDLERVQCGLSHIEITKASFISLSLSEKLRNQFAARYIVRVRVGCPDRGTAADLERHAVDW